VGFACWGAGVAAVVALSAGAAFAGSSVAGFWAVWQEEADRARAASIAIRIWSFATRIFLYEIRIAPLGLKSGEFYQKSYLAICLGSTPKRNVLSYFRHRTEWFPRGSSIQTAESGKRFESQTRK
jgi:hypothetical protein